MAEFAEMCQIDYGLTRKPITTRNPQSNTITEQIYQNFGNIICTFDVSNIVNNNPWSGILAATMFAVSSNYHKTIQASINTASIWPRRHLKHEACCRMGTQILVKRKENCRNKLWFMAPFPITQINDNGTVRLQKWIFNYATNIIRINPFFD